MSRARYTYTKRFAIYGNAVVVSNSLLSEILSKNDSGDTAEFAACIVAEFNLADWANFAAEIFLMREMGQSWSRMENNDC